MVEMMKMCWDCKRDNGELVKVLSPLGDSWCCPDCLTENLNKGIIKPVQTKIWLRTVN